MNQQWQHIETAPAGEDVLLFVPDNEDKVIVAHRFNGDDDPNCWYPQHESQFRGDPYMEITPTHWMPLPDPPAAEGGDRG